MKGEIMKRVLIALVILLSLSVLVGCKSTPPEHEFAQEDTGLELPIPADLREHVERSQKLGFEIYIKDKASWIATDVLSENIGTPQGKVGGWITLREKEDGRPKDSWLVLFFTHEKSPRIAYKIRVFMKTGRQATFEKVDPPVKPDDNLLRLIRARQTAINA